MEAGRRSFWQWRTPYKITEEKFHMWETDRMSFGRTLFDKLERYTKETIWHLTYQVKEFHSKSSKHQKDGKNFIKRLFWACMYFYSMLFVLYVDIGGENVGIQWHR